MPKDNKRDVQVISMYSEKDLQDCPVFTLKSSSPGYVKGAPRWTALGTLVSDQPGNRTYTNGNPVYGEYRQNEKTHKIYQRQDSGLYTQVTPEQIAADWAEVKGEERYLKTPKRTFGQWLGVIFSFGLWRPAAETRPQRYRQCDEWAAISAMKGQNAIGEEEYTRLKAKYHPASSLQGADVETYANTGVVMTEKKKAAMKAKQKGYNKQSKGAVSGEKSPAVYREAWDAINHANAQYDSNSIKGRKENWLGSFGQQISAQNVNRTDTLMATVAYYGKLAKDPQAYGKFGDEYNTIAKELSKIPEDVKHDQYYYHNIGNVLYNLQSIVALTDGKLTLTQLFEEVKKPESNLAYNKIFPRSGYPKVHELGDKINLLMTQLQKTGDAPKTEYSLSNSHNASYSLGNNE